MSEPQQRLSRLGPLRIVLADDHHMFVEAMRLILSQEPEIEVVAVLDNGADLLEAIRKFSPDIALVDVTMEGPGPQKIAKTVAASGNTTSLIALTMHLDHGFAELLLQSGFAGYVVKDDAVAELLNAIWTVTTGGTFMSEAIEKIANLRGPGARILTKREIASLRGAAEGLSNKQIASDLGISERTIKFHFGNILNKLNASSRGEAVAIARRYGLL